MTSLEAFESALRELHCVADIWVDNDERIAIHVLRQGTSYVLGRGDSLEEAMVHCLSEMGKLGG